MNLASLQILYADGIVFVSYFNTIALVLKQNTKTRKRPGMSSASQFPPHIICNPSTLFNLCRKFLFPGSNYLF